MRSPPPEVFDHATATLTLKGPHLEVYDVLPLARIALPVLVFAERFGTNGSNVIFV
jgi:hypothetical protein